MARVWNFVGRTLRRAAAGIDGRARPAAPISVCALLAAALACGCSKKPQRLTIVFSNDLMGKIRSCGCPSNDLGGLGRMATFIKTVHDTAGAVLLLDGGDFFGAEINYGKEKADITMKSMALMKYHGVVPGETDFGLGVPFLVRRSRDVRLPLVLANVFDARSDSLLFPRHAIVTLAGGLRVGLTGVFSDKIKLPPQVESGSLAVRSPLAAVRNEVSFLRPQVDLVVVLAHMDIGEARDLALKTGGIDLIVCGHEGRPMRNARQFNGAYLLQVPKEGRYMGVAGAYLNAQRKIERLAVTQQPISKVFEDDEAIVKLFKAYDIDIALKEKSAMPTGVTRPDQTVRKPFVTAGACGKCHGEEVRKWQETGHARAFGTLRGQSRDFDRDCTSCHTTGFYEIGGFVNARSTPDLVDVQCEACHGNGYDHANDPARTTPANARAACVTCHDDQWSPQFDFASYWQKISH
ncbi:MAG: hypothetical protein HY770_09045 [Chitinivibrionia bacterium]|nr:hypothetical protein [Chitinivibrionia bacterium]